MITDIYKNICDHPCLPAGRELGDSWKVATTEAQKIEDKGMTREREGKK